MERVLEAEVSSGRNLAANFLGRLPERVKPGSVTTRRAVT